MKQLSRAGAFAFFVAGAVILLDQLTKAWVLVGLDLPQRLSIVVWGPLRLTLVRNGGVSFGLFQAGGLWGRCILAAFSLAAVVGMALWARRADRLLTGGALGLIMGGALGNVIDRLRFGTVVDFVDVQKLYFPWVFNFADSAITIGIALLFAEALIVPRRTPA